MGGYRINSMKLLRVYFSAAQQEVEAVVQGLNLHISHRNGFALFLFFSFQLKKKTTKKKTPKCTLVYIFSLNMCMLTVDFSGCIKSGAEVAGRRCIDDVYLCFLVLWECAFIISTG